MYVAALALLCKQLRERAPTTDMLSSVQRLTTLAQVGSVSLDAAALEDAAAVAAAADGAVFLSDLLERHGIVALDIASSVTEAEFLKLGGLLIGPASAVHGSILESAEALGIWNIRVRVPGRTLRPTPAAVPAVTASVEPATTAAATAASAATEPTATEPAPPAPSFHAGSTGTAATADAELAQRVRTAVEQGDGATVLRLLDAVADDALLDQLATAHALQLVVERLLEHPESHEAVHRLLVRTGVAGARAVFEQLIAASELADRRVLYDVAASLPDTLAVARQYAHDPTWYVARNAAGLLGESRNVAAIPDLARLLRHGDTRVRVAAVVALGQIGGPAATARLESVLFDSVPDVRNRALSLVFAAPDADPLADRLVLAVQEESSTEYQLEIIAALSHVHTPRARRKLVDYATSRARSLEDMQLRLAAIDALASGHRPLADDTLRALTADEHADVRERAEAWLRRG